MGSHPVPKRHHRIERVSRAIQRIALSVLVFLPLSTFHLPPDGRAEAAEGLRVVSLSGTPYEMGRQHGETLRDEVRASVGQVLGYFRRYLRIPWMRTWLVNAWLERGWRQAKPFIAPEVFEELRGLADGSGVPLAELYRLHAVPDRTYSCSNFAAWGRATDGGRLIHLRNLDWNIQAGLQRFAVLFIVRPNGKRAYVSPGWAGFIGVLTGINDAQVSIGQVGAETADATFRGEPMAFLMRRVLEESDRLDEAVELVRAARRSVGVNYVIAQAGARRGVALETTHSAARVFEADDPAEHEIAYARPIADAVFRADTAVDPAIRDRQWASGGDPTRPGAEEPQGSSAYDTRYLGQAAGLMAHYGRLDVQGARAIAAAVAPGSNVQSVIFAWPELWVANAQGVTPAARSRYHRFDLEALFQADSDAATRR